MKNFARKLSDLRILPLFLILLAVALATTTVACGKRDGAESAGEKIDDALENTKDAVDDAVDRDGPVEDAGEKIDDKLDR